MQTELCTSCGVNAASKFTALCPKCGQRENKRLREIRLADSDLEFTRLRPSSRPKRSIDDIVQAARAAGMTYGLYVAWLKGFDL